MQYYQPENYGAFRLLAKILIRQGFIPRGFTWEENYRAWRKYSEDTVVQIVSGNYDVDSMDILNPGKFYLCKKQELGEVSTIYPFKEIDGLRETLDYYQDKLSWVDGVEVSDKFASWITKMKRGHQSEWKMYVISEIINIDDSDIWPQNFCSDIKEKYIQAILADKLYTIETADWVVFATWERKYLCDSENIDTPIFDSDISKAHTFATNEQALNARKLFSQKSNDILCCISTNIKKNYIPSTWWD